MDHQIFQSMDHQITQPSITELYDISKMILSGVLILVVLVLLISYQKSNKAKQQRRRQSQSRDRQQLRYQQQQQRQKQKQRLKINNSSFRKSYHFSAHENYTTKEQQLNPQTQLIPMLREDSLPEPMIFSLKQAKDNFLKNLNVKGPSESCIYLDETDKAERQKRKAELQKRKQNNIVYQQPQKIKINQTQKEQLIQQKKVQSTEKKLTIIGEKQIFNDKNKGLIQNKLPETKQPNFNKGSINLPTQGEKGSEAEKKPLFGNIQQLNFPTQPQKIQEAPSLFPKLTPTGPSMFTQPFVQPITEQKPILFSPSPNTQQQTSLFAQKQVTTKPVQKIEKKEQLTQQTQQQPIINLPKPQQPRPASQQPIPSSQPSQIVFRPQPPSQIAKPDYLQLVIDYAKNCKQRCELKKTKTNNFGRSISNLKQIYQTSIDFINTINVGDSKQVETLACVIYDFLLNKTIPAWPKQEGWQMFPPRAKNQTKWKISITTYVLKLNLYRIMGHETLWLIVFGKLLSLLDFTWKRTQQIPKSNQAYKQLDLVKNNYFSLARQDDMAPKYFTRLDLVTYFLFCMTTMDPLLVSEYLCQTAGQDPKTFEEIKKYKYKWSYSCFWILAQTILANKTKTYFKPILYMNMLSAIYLQIRKNKLNPTEFADFEHLRKYIVKEAIDSTSASSIQANQEIQNLADIEEETRDFRFDGEDFSGQLETLNFYFKEKETEYRKATDRKGFEEFERRCSVFDYFKSQGKNN